MPETPQPTPDNDILAAALTYIRRGWYVFPLHAPARKGGCTCGLADCTQPGKHPLIKEWQKVASRDEAHVRAWWKKWPFANVAILTGMKSGLLVIDIDILKGGLESFKAIQEHYGPLTSSLTSNTGSGGAHLLYAHPGAGYLLRNKQRLDGYAGLDVRGDGGYIVAPRSRHWTGTRYEWNVADQQIAPLPTWLLALLQKERESGEGEHTDRAPGDATPEEAQHAISHWTAEALPRAVEGARNATAFWWACQLRDDGVAQLDAEGAASTFYDGLGGKAGFALREIYNAIRSAYRTAPREKARSKSLPFRQTYDNVTQPLTHGTSATQPDAEPSETAERTPRFRILTDTDVERMPPPTWLIDGILPESRLSILFGDYGGGKSFLALDWALCVATGMPWLGHETRKAHALYIAAEGIGGMGKRLHAWKIRHNMQGQQTCLKMIGDAPQLLRAQDMTDLVDDVQALALSEPPAIIVIDTLSRSIVGADENSQADMSLAIASAARLQTIFGAHVMLLHHKPNGGGRTRGSTVLPGGADTLIDLTKDNDLITVTCTKQKDWEEFERIYLRREVVDLEGAFAGETSLVFVERPDKPRNEEYLPKSALRLLQIFEQLPTGAARFTDLLTIWLSTSGMSKRSLSEGLNMLAAKRLIEKSVLDGTHEVWKLVQTGAN